MDQFFTILERFLSVTITDEKYHDSCIDWYLEQTWIESNFTCTILHSHECTIFVWILITPEELDEMEIFYQTGLIDDPWWNNNCKGKKKGVKPYKIEVEINNEKRGPLDHIVSFKTSLSVLPSSTNIVQEILSEFKLNQDLLSFIQEKVTKCI